MPADDSHCTRAAGGFCYICLEESPPLVLGGFGCRLRAVYVWMFTCQTCEQLFTCFMRTQLAEAWFERVYARPEEDAERLAAARNMGNSLCREGKHAEAAEVLRRVWAVQSRVLGPEHPNALTTANDFATALVKLNRNTEAEEVWRHVVKVQMPVLGAAHRNLLTFKCYLAGCLYRQRNDAEGEELLRAVLQVRTRTIGGQHPAALETVCKLANCLAYQRRYAEAEARATQARVMGAEQRTH